MRAGKLTDLGKYGTKLFPEPRQRTLDRASALWKRVVSGGSLWRRSCDPWQGCVTCEHSWQGIWAQGGQGAGVPQEQGCWGAGRPRGRGTCGAAASGPEGWLHGRRLVPRCPLAFLRTKAQRRLGGDRWGPACCLSAPQNQTCRGLSVLRWRLAQAVRGRRLGMAASAVSCPGAEGVPARAGLGSLAAPCPVRPPAESCCCAFRRAWVLLGQEPGRCQGGGPHALLRPASCHPAHSPGKRLQLLLVTSHTCSPLLRQSLIHQIWSGLLVFEF